MSPEGTEMTAGDVLRRSSMPSRRRFGNLPRADKRRPTGPGGGVHRRGAVLAYRGDDDEEAYAVFVFLKFLGGRASLKIFAQVEPTCLGRGPVV